MAVLRHQRIEALVASKSLSPYLGGVESFLQEVDPHNFEWLTTTKRQFEKIDRMHQLDRSMAEWLKTVVYVSKILGDDLNTVSSPVAMYRAGYATIEDCAIANLALQYRLIFGLELDYLPPSTRHHICVFLHLQPPLFAFENPADVVDSVSDTYLVTLDTFMLNFQRYVREDQNLAPFIDCYKENVEFFESL